jgi:glycosyltransferase involved in cell wall biosynthesis
MPSKLQAALAAGRAVMVAADGDARRVAQESGAAFVVDPGDTDALADAIQAACDLGRYGLDQLGNRAREYYDREFSLDRGVRRIEILLESIARERKDRQRPSLWQRRRTTAQRSDQ